MQKLIEAKFSIGNIVKHKYLDFRGVIFDLDPEFNNSEEWYNSIPEKIRPKKNQPFYHLFAENEDIFFLAGKGEHILNIDVSLAKQHHDPVYVLGIFFHLHNCHRGLFCCKTLVF